MTIAITNATLIDGTGADPVRHATVIVKDARIEHAGAGIDPPRDAEIVDAGGRVLMPGMIDAHVHLYGKIQPLQDRLLTPPSLELLHATQNARRTLDSGFTTVRDAGGAPLGLKLGIEQGLIPGPRLRIAVVALSQTGGHIDQTLPSGVDVRDLAAGGFGPEWPHCIVDGVDEARRAVRQVLRAGADVVKLCATGGVLSATGDLADTQFSPEEIAVMVQEAAARGKPCMAHAHGTAGIKNAIRAGVQSIEHGSMLDEEAAHEMIERGAFLVPTMAASIWLRRYREQSPESLLPETARRIDDAITSRRRAVQMAVEMGVRIAMGTDSGVGPHGRNAEELAWLVECGMTPMQAIVAATKTAAECLRVDDETGTVEPGKLADLLLVDGDPLDDVAVLQDRDRLALIMQGGRIHKREM